MSLSNNNVIKSLDQDTFCPVDNNYDDLTTPPKEWFEMKNKYPGLIQPITPLNVSRAPWHIYCAAIQKYQQRKGKPFNLVIFDEKEYKSKGKDAVLDINSLFSSLALAKKYNKKFECFFLMVGQQHVTCGIITAHNNKIKVLHLDASLYYHYHIQFKYRCYYDIKWAKLRDIGYSLTVQFNHEQRQNDNRFCGIFSLYDLIKLHNISRYEYYANWQDKLDSQKSEVIFKKQGVKFCSVKLPLYLKKDMQSTQLYKQNYPDDEKNIVLKKKNRPLGETLKDTFGQAVVSVGGWDRETYSTIERNLLISNFYSGKLFDIVIEFVSKNDNYNKYSNCFSPEKFTIQFEQRVYEKIRNVLSIIKDLVDIDNHDAWRTIEGESYLPAIVRNVHLYLKDKDLTVLDDLEIIDIHVEMAKIANSQNFTLKSKDSIWNTKQKSSTTLNFIKLLADKNIDVAEFQQLKRDIKYCHPFTTHNNQNYPGVEFV